MQLESSSLLSHSRHPPSIFHPYSSPECPPTQARTASQAGRAGSAGRSAASPHASALAAMYRPLTWTVWVKGNRTQRGFGRAAGIVEKSAGQRPHPSIADQGRGQVGIKRRCPGRVQFAGRLECGEAQPAHGLMSLSAPSRTYLRINKIYTKRLVDKFYT